MISLALAALGLAALEAAIIAGLVRWTLRQVARVNLAAAQERAQLLDRLAYAFDKPWMLPEREAAPEREPRPSEFVYDVDQLDP